MRMFNLGLVGLMFGCAATDYSQPVTVDDAALNDAPQSWQTAQTELGEVKVGWIDSFGDPLLSELVDDGLLHNRNLQAAAANVDRARALARQAGAAMAPTVGLGAGAQGVGLVEGATPSGQMGLGLQASWELDLWGRISAGRGAAVSSAQAAEADFLFARYSLAAAVARAYFISIEAGLQQQTAQKVSQALQETLRIVDLRFQEGLASAQELALVRSDLAGAREALEAAKGGQRDAVRSLELLLGRYPGAELDVREDLPEAPAQPPAGVPSSLLERRPDLIAAERRIAATVAGVDQAKAARLPSLSLTADIGGSSGGLSDLLDPVNIAWQAAASLLVPIVDGGARKAEIEIAKADEEAAIAAYAQSALVAFGEVERALDQGYVLTQRLTDLDEARRESAEALRLTQLQFDEGETDLLDVLTIQQRFYARESALLSLQRTLLEQHLDLNLALGGHW